MMRHHLIAAVACATIFLSSAASAQQHKCQPTAEHRLKEYKLEYGDMKDHQWITNRFDRRGESGVKNYTLYAQPPSCSKGDLVIVMSDDCYIQQAYTEHGCRVKGVSSY